MSSRHGRVRCALLLALVTFLVPGVAQAHGRLKAAFPADGAHLSQVPRIVRLDFTESPELAFSSIRLRGPDGREVSLGTLAFAADSRRSLVVPIAGSMDAGTYTITWQMAGDDGHPVRGELKFVVAPGAMDAGVAPVGVTPTSTSTGSPSDTAVMAGMHHDPVSMPTGSGFDAESPLYIAVRWLQFLGLLVAIGAVTFHTFVLAAIRRRPPTIAQADEAAMLAHVEGRAAQVGRVAVMALAMTLVLRLGAQSYAMHGSAGPTEPALMGTMISGTMWGWGWLLQLAGVMLAGIGFHKARTTTRFVSPASGLKATAPGQTHVWWRLAGAGAVLLAFSPGLASHASAAPKLRLLAMLTDGIHVLGASSWLGTLAVILVAGLSATGARISAPFVRELIMAFSPVALVSSGIAASTGVFAAWLHVGTIPNLWGTRYGITLLVKLTILGIVALTGFYNWRFVQPRLGTADATVQLRRTARVEVAVAVLVLLVTAVLVATPTSMDVAM